MVDCVVKRVLRLEFPHPQTYNLKKDEHIDID